MCGAAARNTAVRAAAGGLQRVTFRQCFAEQDVAGEASLA
jgi:hypothetical protein